MTASVNTTRSELASRLRLAIARTARRLRQESDMGLSPSMTAALVTIERHGPLTPSRLAELERIQRPTATRVIDRLQQNGLAERTLDPADGRSRLIAVTAAGSALLRSIRTRRNAYLARRLESLSPEELRTLEEAAGILERVVDEEPA
jgi:DNA-binding MarR family transcriptional regulator